MDSVDPAAHYVIDLACRRDFRYNGKGAHDPDRV
jgi:hypothetical protein